MKCQGFTMSTDCNVLFASTDSSPNYINFFDMGTGQALPTSIDYLPTGAPGSGFAGTSE